MRAPLSHPPCRLQAGNQHQQTGALIHQQRGPQRQRRKQPDKKRQHQPDRRQGTQADGELTQSPPLKNRLLKARQPGYLRSIDFEIDLHTTPVLIIGHIAIRYDITKVVKFLY
ncbi:hypothetical protein [Pseudomonas sp. B14-6]|uniref:hypothetical protein n=1 Tax=Pseudomonas sp. B14-6 TaxID=2738843 RepID=UPI0021145DED|nr:hypothetical protein [Pseudomonas sp. B14-6]